MTRRARWLDAMDGDDTPPLVQHGPAWEHLQRVALVLESIEVADIQVLARALIAARMNRRMVFVAGNGGSAAIASHLVCDLQKVCGIRAIALTDNMPLVTAWANDASYTEVFGAQLHVLADPGDILIVVSCSGTSPNIATVAHIAQHFNPAQREGLATFAIFGEHGREAAKGYSGAVMIPAHDYGVIEDCASAICHALVKQASAG